MTKSLETPSEGRRGWFGRRQRTRSRTQLGAQDRSLFTRFAEATARFMGTSKFILWMTVFVVVWIVANLALSTWMGTHNPWDPYPFILLNLAFSTQASYAAPLIMFAQNRQDDRDRVIAEQDRQQAARTLADTEYLTREIAALRLAVSELATRDFVRSELRDLLADLESREVIPPANDSGTDV
ncbi:hypothetical protein HMPREF0580_0557 [Mobiluncus mulieris ATCC 35239]|uniref:DUF1003 domain-containing protein n=1 Tax=Mobiluncus mulieris ATCC 35239 TaxID=871571 RepID=E0QNU3_9ACTO|nr:DUF1003 domain-containing protein [Mobiluncus mulieris]EEJ52892.1 hypothetical protein HMPREF0577_2205 [Mobiluncus mulieris ATCC 35243]EFM46839.1 hypothetical protein HMPREF0580_0557 [Mobiluncus mulieris ATCC 35239]MCU9970728.1 DUF1003 domain-containing protein [Mobiluncus mulieris]MCU9993599.1 DUF1003 domain-containing protein [Mobiluncus mulieris]MCV0010971.1 DUF1003 domain-containing protein [Mobiluncus mulieris]